MRVVWSVPAADIPEVNDLELIQWEDGTWSVRVETIYEFRERNHEGAYYRGLLDAFTRWMEGQRIPTDEPVDFYPIFSKGHLRFDSIEKTYAFFNAMVWGAYDKENRANIAESLFGILPTDAKEDDPQ